MICCIVALLLSGLLPHGCLEDNDAYRHGNRIEYDLQERVREDAYNYKGLTLAIPDLPKLKVRQVDSLNIPIHEIKTFGLKKVSSATIEILGREMDYGWPRMKYYYYGRIELNKDVDSYLIYGKGEGNGAYYWFKRAMYLVNVKDGVIRSLVTVSEYFCDVGIESKCESAACVWFYDGRFTIGDDYYLYDEQIDWSDGVPKLTRKQVRRRQRNVRERRKQSMKEMGQVASKSSTSEFILGSDGYVGNKNLEDNLRDLE